MSSIRWQLDLIIDVVSFLCAHDPVTFVQWPSFGHSGTASQWITQAQRTFCAPLRLPSSNCTYTHISLKAVLLSVLEGLCGLLFPQVYLFRASVYTWLRFWFVCVCVVDRDVFKLRDYERTCAWLQAKEIACLPEPLVDSLACHSVWCDSQVLQMKGRQRLDVLSHRGVRPALSLFSKCWTQSGAWCHLDAKLL